jgi:hypothetical protein
MLPKGTFSTVGGMIGGPGGALVGAGLSKITGYGDYVIKHNSLLPMGGKDMASNVPQFQNATYGTRIQHREFIRNLSVPGAPSDFDVEALEVGLHEQGLFPWLSGVARRYQKFKVHGMVFHYISTSTDYNNSGTVALALNYNATEGAFRDMKSVLNSMFGVATKPSNSISCPVECDPKTMPEDGYYIRHPDAVIQATDLRLSTLGLLNIATDGLSLPTGTVLGQLWVTYDIELFNPYVPVDRAVSAWSVLSGALTGSNTAANAFNTELNGSPFVCSDYGGTSGVTMLNWSGRQDLVGKRFRILYSVAAENATGTPVNFTLALASIDTGITVQNSVDYPSYVSGNVSSVIMRRDVTIIASSGKMGTSFHPYVSGAGNVRREVLSIFEI